MFQDTSDKPTSFKSTWRKNKIYMAGTSQTDSCNSTESEVQTAEMTDELLQTEEPTVNTHIEVDESKLCTFLEKVYPVISYELTHSSTKAEFEILTECDWTKKFKKLTVLQISNQKQRVSSLSWNAGDNLLSIGFSALHTDWCTHSSTISVFRATFSLPTPIKTLEVSSCVTSMQFHLYEPSILAAGTWSGELFIWNLRKDDDCIIASSTTMPKAHTDAISQILWINNPDPDKKDPVLVTCGSDGCVIVWEVDTHTESIEIIKGFQFNSYISSTSSGRGALRTLFGTLGLDLGVVCFSFDYRDPLLFIVGMEGGKVLKCSLEDPKQISGTSHIFDLDPVIGSYKGHAGTVICLRHSKRNPKIFATSSLDKRIHVYRKDELAPVNIIQCKEVAIGIDLWNLYEQMLLAWGMNGFVRLFNISQEKDVQANLCDDYESVTVCSSVFTSPSEQQLLAIGDSDANITIWEVQI